MAGAAVKRFDKREKGAEPFWQAERVEPIPMLWSMWISQDDRWSKFWVNRSAHAN